MFSVDLIGLPETQHWLAELPDKVNAELVAKSQDLTQALMAKVQDALSGGVLESRTGKLLDSVTSDTQSNGSTVTGSVSAGGDVPYAAIQEYGGSTKAHIIEALNGKTLAFAWQGKNVFFPHVNHPGSVIPARSYMQSSLDDMQDDIPTGFADAFTSAVQD